jgi:sulfate permease, SulP family
MNSDRYKSLANQYIPITGWIGSYNKKSFKNDLRAGLTVGIMLIPQGMAYALLAGMPPVYGLYASIVPLIVYAIFGTSRQLSIGPMAIISILVAVGISDLAPQGSERYIELALLMALMVGVTQFLMGLFRMGFLINFISTPVLSGFISGAAFIIGFSQLGHLLGLDIGHASHIHTVILDVLYNIYNIHLETLIVGAGSILMIYLLKKTRLPASLIAVVLSIITVWVFNLDNRGVDIIGDIRMGYPAPVIPSLTDIPFRELFPSVLAIAFIGFTLSMALAKSMVRRHPEYELDSNQELFSLGLSNLAGSFFHAFPVAGSLSRTVVNEVNRAETGISSIISAVLVLATVLFLLPLIYYLPNAVLAAIIITAVPSLVEIGEVKFLWRVKKRECILMLITFFATLVLGILEGIGIGVLISLVIVIHRSSHPNIVMLGRVPNTDTYRDLDRYPEALTQTNTIIIRVDASLYFANISYMRKQFEKLEKESGKTLKHIIFDAVGINEVDSSALHALKEMIDNYYKRGIKVHFAGVKGPVRDVFKRSGLSDVVGEKNFFPDINEAVDSLEDESEEASHLAE